MCSSLISWMLSMEPLAKGTVRGIAPPQPLSLDLAQWIALLVAIEDKLGLLRNLPHTHRPVPAPSRHTAFPAQGIQRSDSILVPKAGGGEGAEGGWGPTCTGTCICTPFPRAHSQCLHIGVLCHVPHLHRTVMGCAIELVGSSAECQTLQIHGQEEKWTWTTAGEIEVLARGGFPPKKHVTSPGRQGCTPERPPHSLGKLSLPPIPLHLLYVPEDGHPLPHSAHCPSPAHLVAW